MKRIILFLFILLFALSIKRNKGNYRMRTMRRETVLAVPLFWVHAVPMLPQIKPIPYFLKRCWPKSR